MIQGGQPRKKEQKPYIEKDKKCSDHPRWYVVHKHKLRESAKQVGWVLISRSYAF